MTGILSSAQICPGCSRLSASLTKTGCHTRHAHVHRLCKASAVVRVTPSLLALACTLSLAAESSFAAVECGLTLLGAE